MYTSAGEGLSTNRYPNPSGRSAPLGSLPGALEAAGVLVEAGAALVVALGAVGAAVGRGRVGFAEAVAVAVGAFCVEGAAGAEAAALAASPGGVGAEERTKR